MSEVDEVRVVAPADWPEEVRRARDEGFAHFDWLGCVDDIGREPSLRVVLRLLRPDRLVEAVRLITSVPRERPELGSIASLFDGAAWHERESAELYDLTFVGGDPRRLLLDEAVEAGPLRKDRVLGARAGQSWPGAVEPGESDSATPRRRRLSAPGVPAPEVWGDRDESGASGASDPDEIVRSSGGGRARRRP